MSTLSGIVSKGEKGKTKYQSIDINSLYRSSRGESLEQHQQKNTVPRKHGMQSLGKVPSARRPPANLPSLRSEISSSDPAVSLVPSGGSGWATTKEATSTTNTTTINTPTDNTTTNSLPAQCTTGPTPATLAPQQHPPLPGQQNSLQSSHPSEAGNKSSWSAIMSKPGDAAIGYAGLVESGRGVRGALGLSFLAHQSPQFQHEFPSLSGQSSASVSTQSQGQQQTSSTATNAITNAAQHHSMLQQQSYIHNHSGGGPTGQLQPQQTREMNAQYGPGPSLRPQTEGSWIQGGSRIASGPGTGAAAGVAGSGNIQGGPGLLLGPTSGQAENPVGGRPNLGLSPGMAMAPAGQHVGSQNNQPQVPTGQHQVGPNMHHYRGIIPPFMYKGNFTGGNFVAPLPAGGPRPRFNYPADRSPARQQQRQDRDRGVPPSVEEEIQTRPIIKEEDLSRMDEISCEAGWTATDDIDYNQKLAFSDDEADDQLTTASNKREDNRKDQDKLAHEEKHMQDDKELNSREKEQKENNVNISGRNESRNESRNDARNDARNDTRNDMQSLRSWNNQGPMSRDYRGPPGPPPSNYPPQQTMRTTHSLRAGGDEEELWNQRRREQVSEKVASAVELARQRKEEEEKRFQESMKQAAAKKLQDLENKLKEKHKHKDEEHQNSVQANDSNKSNSSGPASAATIPATDWERDRESRDVRERSCTSSSEGTAKEADVKASREQSSTGQQATSSNMKSGSRRTRADSEVSGPLDDEGNGRPNSRVPPPMRADDRHRHSGHRTGSGYDSGRKQTSDAGYYEDYPRRGSERYKDYEDRHASNRDGVGNWSDHSDRRGYDEKSESRDARDKKDYDNYSKGPVSQNSFDDQQAPVQQHGRSESSGQEWREDRRDIRVHEDRSVPSSDIGGRRGDEQRSERPQRPDSRDSRTSRESRTSLRGPGDDDGNGNSSNFHKPLRDSGSSSWAACNDFPDYEDNKNKQQHQRDIFRDDIRDRERDRDRDVPTSSRDRRQQSGLVNKDKLDQDELKRGSGPLKRGIADTQDKKDKPSKNGSELLPCDSKKDNGGEVWSRGKPERNTESGGRNSPKVSSWADAVSPSFEKEEEEKRIMIDSQHNDDDDDDNKKLNDLKQSIEKLSMDNNKRGSSDDADKDDQKDDKRDKKSRNRANSSGSRGPRGGEPRGPRQWGSGGGSGGGGGGGSGSGSGGAFNVYGQRWRGAEVPTRGRRGGAPRSVGGRPGSSKSGAYERTDSELSGDELVSSIPIEPTKEERRSSSARSPKPSVPKGEKDERNRNVASRKDEQQQQQQQQSSRRDYGQSRSEKKSSERGDYEVRGSGRPSREGFAPSGEPSRRGRGGFRHNRGPTTSTGGNTGGRMEGYGPPPTKSPFSSERVDDKHTGSGQIQQHSSTPSPSEHEDLPVGLNQSESSDDKIIAKQQALTAGITGRHAKSPNRLNTNHGNINVSGGHLCSAPRPAKKEESRSKRPRSGSRRGRGGGERSRVINNINSVMNKQNSGDPGNEDWETTSENSEEHADERKDGHGPRSNKSFSGRGERQNSNIVGNNREQHGRDQRGPRGDKGLKSSNSQSNRTLGMEKGRNVQNITERSSQRNHHSGNVPPLIQNSQSQNGRPRSQSSANVGPINSIKPMMNKDTTVNRIDEIKLNDPNLVNQALNDINNKSQSKDKRGVNIAEIDMDSNCIGGDDAANAGDDNKLDADGFQEVRSKKNVKESSRQQQQKEEQQSSKPGRRDREKDRGERDRSKSKTNGAQSQQQQQGQNISMMLGQSMNQLSGGVSSKQYERNVNRLIAPRFQKQQRLAKHQQARAGPGGNEPSDSATGGPSSRSPPSPAVTAVPPDMQLMSGLAPVGQNSVGAEHDSCQIDSQQQQSGNSTGGSQRNSPNCDKVPVGKMMQPGTVQDKSCPDASSPPVQTLIFENTNYSKNTKNTVGSASDMAIKSKYSNHIKSQSRDKRVNDLEDDGSQMHQQQTLAVAFSNKANDLMKDKVSQQEPIQMPLSFNNKEDNVDMKLDFTFDSDLTQLTEDKNKSLGMPRSMHITGGQSTISPSTAELNLKIASVKKVWENAPPMPTVVEHEVDGNVVNNANSFPQAFESNDDETYSAHQQYNQGNMKNEITTSTNVCKVKPQQQSSGGGGAQQGSSVPGPSPIGPGQSPIGHPPASLQGPLSPPPFNSTGQPSHINYQEFAQYPGSQAAQYGSMSAIPSPPAVLFNTGSGQLPAQAGGLYGAFQLDQSRSPFTQYPPYAASLQSSFNQQNMYLQQPPPPHAPNAPTPDIYQSNLSQYRITAAAAPPFGQNQQLSNNPNTVLISSSSNSLMSASVKPSSQPIGAIGTKAPHFQAPSAPPQPNQLAYIPYDPNQVLGVSGSYMGNSQLVQRPGPNVQQSANNYYSATSADVFSGSQTGFYQPGGAAQQTGAHYGLQGFGQHSQSLATGNAAPVGLQNFSSQFLSGSGLQIAAAAAAQQYRNPTGGLPGPANAAATFLNKHQQQEQPRQLKSPSGNQQDVLASVFSSTPQIPSPKSRKQQSSSQQPQPSPTQHHKFQQYQGVSQSALVSSYTNYVLQQNVRAMGMPPRGGIQPSQQRYPPPIQRPVVPFPPGPNPNNSQQGQQQQNCMPNQQQQQTQMNRHRPNIHQQQQQQRNMKMQQQYYSGQSNPKMDSNDKVDSHNDKISDSNVGNQTNGNKNNANPPESDHKEEVSQQNE